MKSVESIIETVRSNPKIPAPSPTVFKILELTNDPDSDVRTVAAAIGRDAGLTAQLLRQANSALYGCQVATFSVSDACVRLGFKRIRSAVINQHVVTGLGRSRPPGFDAHRYWQSAFATHVAAQELAKKLLPAQAEEAGTAGLLCDIGVGMLAFGLPEEYQRVLAELKNPAFTVLHEIEQRMLGVTHAEVGALVLAGWNLGENIVEAVRGHHADPLDPAVEERSRFSRIVATGVSLSDIALSGSDMDRVAALFAHVEGLAPDAEALVNDLLDGLVAGIQQTAESLAVELGPVDQIQSNFEDLTRCLPDVGGNMSFRPMASVRDVESANSP